MTEWGITWYVTVSCSCSVRFFCFCLPVVCLECTEFVTRVEFCMSIDCSFCFTYDAVVFVIRSEWPHCGWHDIKCSDWLTSFMVFVCREGPHFTAGVRHLPHHEKVWPLEGHPEEPVRPLFQRNFHQSYVSILFLCLSSTPCLQSVCTACALSQREPSRHVMSRLTQKTTNSRRKYTNKGLAETTSRTIWINNYDGSI